jgi:hypothetical protein
VHSILAPESGRFLNAVTTYYFNRVPDVAMVRLVRRRLLMRLVPLGTVPCASSGQVVDELGEHFIKCPRQGLGCGHHEVKVATQRVYGPIAKANRMRVVSEPALERYQRPGSVAAAGERKVKTRADLGFLDINERRTIFADVRTATIKTPETAEQIGSTVSLAEKAKGDDYAKRYDFPEGVSMLPIAIDSYGRWGAKFVEQLKRDCKRAAGGRVRVYNQLISNARTQVSIAHAKAIGMRLHKGIHGDKCIINKNALATI